MQKSTSGPTWPIAEKDKGVHNFPKGICLKVNAVRGVFNKFPDFFVQAFRIVVDSWKFSMLLLYILWDDWPIFMISGSNEQLQQQLSLLVNFKNAIWHFRRTICNKISKMQSDTLEERYAIKLCFKLGKNATETYVMLQTTFRPSCMNWASVFEWHKRFKAGSLWGMMRDVGGVRKSIHQIDCPNGSGYYVEILGEFRKRFCWKRPALFKSGQWHFQEDNVPVHNSIPVTDYLSKMGIKTVPHPTYSPDLALCDFWLFPKLRGCRYETIKEMKKAVTKVIDTLTQEDFHGAFQRFLERYNKCIAAGGDYFEGD